MPRIQIPVEISDGSWTRVAATGASSASTPNATASVVDGADRPMTNASTDTSNRSGSSCPERCATTAGTITASDSASNGTPRTNAHTRNGAAASPQRTRSAPDDGSATAAMMAVPTAKTGSAGAAARPATTPETTPRTHVDGTAVQGLATPPGDGDATSYPGGRHPGAPPSRRAAGGEGARRDVGRPGDDIATEGDRRPGPRAVTRFNS